jgi:sortase A
VETKTDWFVYRMLPKDAEAAKWSTTKAGNSRCENVKPLGGAYTKTGGQEIVTPDKGGVIAPVPHEDASVKPTLGLLTLTTCHPRFSDRQRLIVHSVLVKQWAKDPAKATELPPELKENS